MSEGADRPAVRLRFGVLRLTDSAPAVVAQARGLFAALGLDAEIVVEPSWANILDKLTWGLLDAASMLPPLALAAAMGLRGPRARLVVPMGLTSGGNSVVVNQAASVACAGPSEEAAHRLVGWMRAQPAKPRLGVVHLFSSHNLLLRQWLMQAGGRPDRDWETVVVPPEQVVDALAAGQVAGFCAGAPWGGVAQAKGVGEMLVGSSRLWPGHPEKCLCVATAWAESKPDGLVALTRAMLQACAICNDPVQGDAVADMLAGIGLPRRETRSSLPGGDGQERVVFASTLGMQSGRDDESGGIWHTDRQLALWFVEQMQEGGWASRDMAPDVAAGIYRPDLLLPGLEAETRPAGT